MGKYNFQVKATVTGYIQRSCDSDEEAEKIKEDLESYGFSIDEFMPGVEVDVDDAQVVVYGENEG